MADTPEPQAEKKIRRLRTSTETVRERSAKAQAEAGKPVTPGFGRAFASGFLWPLRKMSAGLATIGQFKPVGIPARFIGRILLPRYVRGSWRELRQVTWPDRRTSWALTSAVIMFAIVFGILVAVTDYGLDKLFKEILVR